MINLIQRYKLTPFKVSECPLLQMVSVRTSFEPNVTLVIGKLEQEDRSITFVTLQKEQLLFMLLKLVKQKLRNCTKLNKYNLKSLT